MSFTIPSDIQVAGDTGHVDAHNNLSDMVALVTAICLQLYDRPVALPTGNVNNPANASALAGLSGSSVSALLSTQLGVANGVAALDNSGFVPLAQLPASVVNLFLAGTGSPSSGTGNDGDTYEDTATGRVYTRAGGVWTAAAALPGWGLLATTGAAGFVLQNATPTILSWTTPSDGAMHRFTVFGVLRVTTLEAGGQLNYSFTDPSGGTVSVVAIAAAQAVGGAVLTARNIICQPGTTVSLVQQSALTSGAATVYAELWGS